ncbi:hypothetical protein SADUNF_Sadunf01G0034000 [Salix dunnii]|uniref:Uncharacterized protein n=1 Tax=Salix dunnii TaxID=1413687 RepID=A0A835N9C8_9ROSI|nr:hypothetical protein SADUNF_Sadunf01G0034000 [Salix dunnii]
MNPRDPLSDQIQISLQNLSTTQSLCSIFKVPHAVRSINDRAYEPEILSIGPYHRGKDDLKMMEDHKKHYLQMFLQRKPGNSLTSYVTAMRDLEERARQYYQKPVSLEKDAFVEMLLFDGCFIVELICKIFTDGLQNEDPVTGNLFVLSTVSHDMLLLENQLPFCVLLKLFSMTTLSETGLFGHMALCFFRNLSLCQVLGRRNIFSSQECKHLLNLVYHDWLLPSPSALPNKSEAKNIKLEFIRSVKELKEAGIRLGNSLQSYVAAIRGLEEQARQYYDQPISLVTDAFVEMLLLDGYFIVELICKLTTSGPQQGDPVSGNSLVLNIVSDDMLLLENQLPFCVLLKLFSMAMLHKRDPFKISPGKDMNRRDPLADKIQMSLQNLSTNQSTSSIFKVPSVLRSVNNGAYEPKILSIGPYHRGKDDLKMMEEHKKHYLNMFLRRRSGNSLPSYVAAMRGLEERARQYYDQTISLGTDAFVEMLVYDGCFIVELICKITTPGHQQEDPVSRNSLVFSTISHDMLLLENQLPFCVLLKLFSMAMPDENDITFIKKASVFFKWMFPGSRHERRGSIISFQEFKHLLDLVYHNWLLPSPSMLPSESDVKNINLEFIRSAKELKEAGIKFGKQAGSYGLFQGVRFEKGMIKIPCLKVVDTTESLFRNLIAYEQCSQRQHLYVTDYITLMDCLINTREDVQILRHCGIIVNGLGDDEMVCNLFNKLGIYVMMSDRDRFFYAQEFKQVEKHCARRRNVWLAKLRRDYFNSPWTLISFIAALSLLLLTFLQTLFTIMSHFKETLQPCIRG